MTDILDFLSLLLSSSAPAFLAVTTGEYSSPFGLQYSSSLSRYNNNSAEKTSLSPFPIPVVRQLRTQQSTASPVFTKQERKAGKEKRESGGHFWTL